MGLLGESVRNRGLMDLFDYTDYRQFVRDWLESRPRRLGISWLAGRVTHQGFELSRQLLAGILQEEGSKQRTLKADGVDAFARAMNLDSQETEYFRLLVEGAGGAAADPASDLSQKLNRLRSDRRSHWLQGHEYETFGRWEQLAILELARIPGFRADPEWIAAQMDPPIKVEAAAEALRVLKAVGLLREVGGDILPPEEKVLQDSQKARSSGLVRDLHLELMDRNKVAIDHFSRDERTFYAATISAPDNLIEPIRQVLRAAVLDVLAMCANAEEPAERVHQVNLGCFPLTRKADEPRD